MSEELKPTVQRPATYTFEDDPSAGRLYYFALVDRQSGPYKNQRHVDAIIDIAHDGTLAGVELIENMPPAPSPAAITRLETEIDVKDEERKYWVARWKNTSNELAQKLYVVERLTAELAEARARIVELEERIANALI